MPIDRDLVEACRRGDPDAFERVVRETSRPLYTLIWRIVGNHDDAADALQETYLRAWRGMRSFRGDADLATWLHRVATNVALTQLRRRARAPQPVEEEVLAAATPAGDQTDSMVDAEVVHGALRRLPAAQRAAVVLKDVYGWPVEEIAKAAGMTEGAVKVRLFRARRRLAGILAAGSGGEEQGRVVRMKKRKAT